MRRRRWLIRLGLMALVALALWRSTASRAPQVGEPLELPPALRGRIALFVLAGQSNMAASGLPTYAAPADPGILVYDRAGQWRYAAASRGRAVVVDASVGAGPGLAFAQQLRAARPDVVVGLIPCAQNGASLSQWRPDSPVWTMYADCVSRARRALGVGHLAGLLFFQGETDARSEPLHPAAPLVPGTWAAEFGALVAAFRSDLGMPRLPVVFAQIGTTDDDAPNWELVRQQQRAVDLPGVVMITTDDLARTDEVHYTPASYQAIGARFAAAYLALPDTLP